MRSRAATQPDVKRDLYECWGGELSALSPGTAGVSPKLTQLFPSLPLKRFSQPIYAM